MENIIEIHILRENINNLIKIIDKKNKEIDYYKNELDIIIKENIFLKKNIELLKSIYITKYD